MNNNTPINAIIRKIGLISVLTVFCSFSGLAQIQPTYEVDTFDVIYDWITEVDTNLVLEDVQHLQDFYTRECLTPQAVEAQNWIKDQFESLGLSTEIQLIPMPGNPSDNVIATLTGKLLPEEYVVIGGHYDSYTGNSFAPGADDNASGTAGVIEVARILSHYEFQRTIIFCAFSAEEYGLYGSEAYAKRCEQQGMEILGYFNMDMIGYQKPGTYIHTDIIAPPMAQPLVDFYTDVSAIYLPDFIIEEGILTGGDSDHTPFNNHGYLGIFPFEDAVYHSPFIHTTQDVVGTSYNSGLLAGKLIQAGLASVATLAIPYSNVGITETTAHEQMTSIYPNPARLTFNIKSEYPEPVQFELFSLQGVSLVKGQFSNLTSVDVTGIAPGTYIVKIFNNQFAEHKKLIIR
jgi:hypothetical protein